MGTYIHRKVQAWYLHFKNVCFATDIEQARVTCSQSEDESVKLLLGNMFPGFTRAQVWVASALGDSLAGWSAGASEPAVSSGHT